jgi:hypothetical protein
MNRAFAPRASRRPPATSATPQASPPLQTSPPTEHLEASADLGHRLDSIPVHAPNATGMPAPLRRRMEVAFNADFSKIRVRPASPRAKALGTLAFTQGHEIHMAPGQWAPDTRAGQQLLGHELTHVLQQRAGRVRTTARHEGVGLNAEPALEREADALGARAVQGTASASGGPAPMSATPQPSAGSPATAPVQGFWPLEYMLDLMGSKKTEPAEPSFAPISVSPTAKYGETHKPLKVKEKDELASRWLIGNEPPGSEKSAKKTKPTPEETAPTQNQTAPIPDLNGPFGMKPGSYTAPAIPMNQPQGESPSLLSHFKTKTKWLDWSLGGGEKEQALRKMKGDGYSASLLRSTYDRELVGGGGKDKMYSVTGGESASAQFVHGKGKHEREVIPSFLKAQAKGEGQLGGVEGGYGYYAKGDMEEGHLSAGLRGSAGAYAAKGSLGGSLSMRIPFTNIALSLGGKAEAAYGAGLAGEAALKANKSGVKASLAGKFASGLGLGGGVSLGIGKYDPDQFWLGGKSDEAYLKDLPKSGTADRWKGVPPEVKQRLRKQLRKGSKKP